MLGDFVVSTVHQTLTWTTGSLTCACPTTTPASATPTVNNLASSPPEHSTEAVSFYPAPSGTGTHSPLMQ